MNSTSPPAPVTANPVATPGVLVRSGTSSVTFGRPIHVASSSAAITSGVAAPVATFAVAVRTSRPSWRSSDRTPASRV